jgi:2-dehydro-3-deoxyglucarate aldolase
MFTSSEMRERLKRGVPVVGTWLQLPSPDAAEIIARLGYAWAAVDLEHGAFTRAVLPDMFRALERWGTLPFARVAEADMSLIKAALDSGARGLIFPMIAGREQLDAAIAFSLYPGGAAFPSGRRGVGFSRANVYGLDLAEHTGAEGLGQSLVLVAQIEQKEALAHLDAIFSHPRLDACMVGPSDLSASMGLTGQFEAPEFLEALALIERKAREHGVALGYHVVQPDPALLAARIKAGYAFLAYGIDTVFLHAGALPPKL